MVVDELSQEEADRVFHALADATRRDIVVRVLQGEQSVSALADHYPMSFAAVQKHVAVLQRADLVAKRRRGREQLVSGNVATIRRVGHLLDQRGQLSELTAVQTRLIVIYEQAGEGEEEQD